MQDWPQDQGPGALCLYHPSRRSWVEFFPGMHFQYTTHHNLSSVLKFQLCSKWERSYLGLLASTRSQDGFKYSSLEVKPSLRISPCVIWVFESSASLFFMFSSASVVLCNVLNFLFQVVLQYRRYHMQKAETRIPKQLFSKPYLIWHWPHAAEEEADCQCQIADWSICCSRWSSLCTR